jgi:hypothetical protein
MFGSYKCQLHFSLLLMWDLFNLLLFKTFHFKTLPNTNNLYKLILKIFQQALWYGSTFCGVGVG